MNRYAMNLGHQWASSVIARMEIRQLGQRMQAYEGHIRRGKESIDAMIGAFGAPHNTERNSFSHWVAFMAGVKEAYIPPGIPTDNIASRWRVSMSDFEARVVDVVGQGAWRR